MPPMPPATVLDITADTCPMTFVRTRLALDRLSPGDVLEVRLRGSEPLRNVSVNAVALGHALLDTVAEGGAQGNGVTTLRIRRC